MDLKVFVADDDAGMRLTLRKILENMDGIECVGEAADGGEAVRRCMELKPDVVFLDVQMPVLDGTGAAKELSKELPNTALVFVTAYSEYMPDAFDLYAADYLLKPFKIDRVRQTLGRLQKTKFERRQASVKTLMLKNKDGLIFLPIDEILLIRRENRQTHIETADASLLTSEGLSELWQKIEGKGFLRSHRQYIINISAVTKVYPYGRWTYLLKLKGTEKDALITHEKLEELQGYLT